MLTNYPESERCVLKSEGGYTDDPRDPGGPTNWGITIFDARKFWKAGANAADVKAMPRQVAERIYKQKYWDALSCDALPAGLDYAVFDYGVNSGIGRSGKVLRRLLSLPDNDWKVTPQVIAAITIRAIDKLIQALDDERLRFLKSLSTWDHFGKGWGVRVASVNAIALHMAAHPAANDNRPPPQVAQANETAGKGMHAPVGRHQATKAAVSKGGAAASVASGGFCSWLGAHPGIAIAVAAGGAAVTIAAIELIEQRFNLKQEAPTPGLVPVPAAP